MKSVYTEENVRIWEKSFKDWGTNGCPENNPEYPWPDEHPDPDHLWNTDWQAYVHK